MVVWGDDVGVTWTNASQTQKEQFALQRLFWFFRMSEMQRGDRIIIFEDELDKEVYDQAKEAAEWYGSFLKEKVNLN